MRNSKITRSYHFRPHDATGLNEFLLDVQEDHDGWSSHSRTILARVVEGNFGEGRFANFATEAQEHHVALPLSGPFVFDPILHWLGDNAGPWNLELSDPPGRLTLDLSFARVADAVACKLIFHVSVD